MRLGEVACAVVSVALGACSLHQNVGDSAVDYNKSYETSNNGIILLNVLRAKDRLPMHFSTLSKVSGKLNYTVQSQLQFPFGQNLSANGGWFNQFQSFLNVQGGPNYDISTENTKEFMQGILSPADMDKLAYYWQQGWPRSLLLHMFLQSVEKKCEDAASGTKSVTHYNNGDFAGSPDDRGRFKYKPYKDFADLIHGWIATDKMRVEAESNFTPIGPPLEKGALQALLGKPEALAAARKEGIVLACRTPAARGGQETDCGAATAEGAKIFRLGRYERRFVVTLGERTYRIKEEPSGKVAQMQAFGPKPGVKSSGPVCRFELSFRSVQGMIYYLGEIARAQESNGFRNDVVFTAPGVPLFVLRKGTGDTSKAVADVSYRGDHFSVPLDVKTRSAQVFALIDQLFGLSRKADTLQATPTVRVQN